ncbi:MAG: DUF4249 domain-containing protein [Bacteroidota bacterium]|jgi:hypothetical protein
MKTKRNLLLQTIFVLIFIFIAWFLYGCQQVVSIDLNTANPRVVIEGNIKDQLGPYSVFLSMTGSYFDTTLVDPPISHAQVVITDNYGNRDTLKEVISGTYQSSKLIGVPGRTYTLSVNADGKDYMAISSMPSKVFIDSLYVIPRHSVGGESGYDIYVIFKDPSELGNYYRINAHSSAVIPADSIDGQRYRLFTDKLTNGNEMTERIRAGRNVNSGDTITIELCSIDKASYDYFHTLSDILSSDRSPTSLSPANPNSNISGDALGYFAAYTVDTRKIIIP